MVCLRPGRRPQRWKIRVLCCARGVLLRHWWGVREHHAPTDARGTGWLGIGTEHALHTHTLHTHTHTHAHTGTHAQPHTHTHGTHAHTHARQHRPGTHGVLQGCSRGAPRVRMSAPQVPLHRIRPALPWVRPRPRRVARADLAPNRQAPLEYPSSTRAFRRAAINPWSAPRYGKGRVSTRRAPWSPPRSSLGSSSVRCP